MLTWTQGRDGWYSNGYVIRLAEPFRWVLTEANEASSAIVSVQTEPLATGRTLTECKREAELLAAADARSQDLRRYTAQLLISLSFGLLVIGAATPWGFFLTSIAAGFALAAVGRIIGVACSPISWRVSDFFYQ